LLSCMGPDGTQCRQGPPDAVDTTRYGAWVQDAQDAQDAESRLGESGRNTTVSDAGHLFADVEKSICESLSNPLFTSVVCPMLQYRSHQIHQMSPSWKHTCLPHSFYPLYYFFLLLFRKLLLKEMSISPRLRPVEISVV